MNGSSVMRCVHWIPAFAGMTVVPAAMRRADFIPAFAGMTVVPTAMRRADFIPAFAGMTVKLDAFAWTAPKFPARQLGQVP